MVNRARSLLIVSWAFIAVAVRLEQGSGSVAATAAVGLRNLTVVVGTPGSDRGVLSRVDLAIPPGIALTVAASAYLSRVVGSNLHDTVPAAFGGREDIQARSAPWKVVANNTLQDLFTNVPSDQGVTDNLFGQTVEELVGTNHELQKDAEDINSLMVDTLSSVEAPEDKLVTLADKLMKLGKTMVQHSHPSLIHEDIAPKASQSKTPMQMAGLRVVDNALKPLFLAYKKHIKQPNYIGLDQMQWESNVRRLEKVLLQMSHIAVQVAYPLLGGWDEERGIEEEFFDVPFRE